MNLEKKERIGVQSVQNREGGMSVALDEIDVRILNVLAGNADITSTELAAQVSLSIPAVNKRVAKLHASGVIRRTTILTDAKAVGKPVTAYVLVIMERFSGSDRLLESAAADPDILECYAITGEYDYILKICASDIDELEKKILTLKSRGVAKSNTMFTLREHKFSPIVLPEE